MKLTRPYDFPPCRFLLAVLATLFTLCVAPANGASEPGTVTLVLEAEPVNLDSGNWMSTIIGQILGKNIFEALVDIDPDDGRLVPRLANSWKQVDTRTWHFFLRKGVKFHDGQDFNAEAVIFSIKRMYDTRIDSKTRAKFFSHFKMEVKALDSHTVEVKTDIVEPLLLTLMGFMPMCSPNTPADRWTRQPIGTGPYKFVKWDAGTQIIFERFDGYWGKQPQVKKAVYVWRAESPVRAAMVEIGEADLAEKISPQDAKRPDMDFSYLNSETTCLRIGGTWDPPLNDLRVRMALNYAVDRNAIRGSILGKDVVPASQLIVPSISGYNPDIKVWPYDPKKARQLLDEARKDGVPVDNEISLIGRTGLFPGGTELMEAIMSMYNAVGFRVKLRMLEAGAVMPYRYTPYPKNAGPYLMLLSHDNNFRDAVFTFYYNYHCKGNSSSMCDKTVDDLIEKAQAASGEERKKAWQAAFKRIHEEIIPNVMLFHMVAYTRVGKRISFKPSIATNAEIPLSQITFR
jgi:peptide/nickel transport system substrate-binding protein